MLLRLLKALFVLFTQIPISTRPDEEFLNNTTTTPNVSDTDLEVRPLNSSLTNKTQETGECLVTYQAKSTQDYPLGITFGQVCGGSNICITSKTGFIGDKTVIKGLDGEPLRTEGPSLTSIKDGLQYTTFFQTNPRNVTQNIMCHSLPRDNQEPVSFFNVLHALDNPLPLEPERHSFFNPIADLITDCHLVPSTTMQNHL